MKIQKFDRTFLTSKVARRIFLLFMFCSILPFLILSIITHNSVSSQLNDQAQIKLKRTAKDKGFEIYDRLLFLESEMKMMASRLKNESVNFEKIVWPFETDKITRNRFVNIVSIDNNYHKIDILNTIKGLPKFSETEHRHMSSGKTLIKVWFSEKQHPSILMSLLVDPNPTQQQMLVAEVNPIYLWGIGAKNTLPPEVEYMVFQEAKNFLISSIQDIHMEGKNLEFIKKSTSGTFNNTHKNDEYITSFWTLFIKPGFLVQDWVILISQLKSTIYEPIASFKRNFLHFMLLTFCVVSLLSIILIRKSLVPIETLRSSTQKIANGELDIDVNIKSGDEFEMLGKSFNEMSKKLKEGQRLLVQAAKTSAMGQVSAGIVHEIGQPLTSIYGLTELLLLQNPTEMQKRRIKIIKRELMRLRQIVQKFGSFTQTTEDIMTSISINQVIDEVYFLLEHHTGQKGIDLIIEKADDLLHIYGDKDSLKQVFINLIINSVNALEHKLDQDPFIRVRTFASEKLIHVETEDNGVGIAKEVLPHIFDPFFTTKNTEIGSGLGLAIIDSILHKHNAQIEVESEVDRGTIFKISFPIP